MSNSISSSPFPPTQPVELDTDPQFNGLAEPPDVLLDDDDFLVARQTFTGAPVAVPQPPFMIRTKERINRANISRRARGKFGGLTLGSERFFQLDKAWGGIDHGIHLIGGESNVGKSAMIRMLAWDIARFNEKVHVRVYTIDDAEDYFLSCVVSQAANVPINSVDKPEAFINNEEGYYNKSHYEQMVQRGDAMYDRFINGEFVNKFSFVGISSLDSASWETIERDIREVRSQLASDIELCVFVDNFHDIEIPEYETDKNRLTEEVAIRSGRLAEQLKIAIIGTVELKKNQQRRPIMDDIRGASKWKYKARTVMLVYSEVGVGKPNPRIYHERPETPGEKSSVLEVHFAKAKGNAFKGRLFYNQLTECGICIEVSRERAQNYAMQIS